MVLYSKNRPQAKPTHLVPPRALNKPIATLAPSTGSELMASSFCDHMAGTAPWLLASGGDEGRDVGNPSVWESCQSRLARVPTPVDGVPMSLAYRIDAY